MGGGGQIRFDGDLLDFGLGSVGICIGNVMALSCQKTLSGTL